MNLKALRCLSALIALAAPAVAQSSVGNGYVHGGPIDISYLCGSFPATATMSDGSYLLYDGRNLSRRSAGGNEPVVPLSNSIRSPSAVKLKSC